MDLREVVGQRGEPDGRDDRCGGAGARVADLARDVMERFASMTVEDVRGRYSIGRLVLTLGSEEVPVAGLARIVGCSTKALYQYCVVAKRFREDELEHWLARRSADGQPPSWSHFVLLCSVASRSRRAAILEQWLAEPVGVRELAAKMRLQAERIRQTAGG